MNETETRDLEEAVRQQTADAAGRQSASFAMRTGFLVLRVAMILLALYFLFHNIYWVSEGYVAVQTRFGAIVNKATHPVRLPGGPYFALPSPLDNTYKIPTTVQTVTLDQAFYVERSGDDAPTRRVHAPSAFIPSRDGSLITSDKNIVQGVWTIHYRIGNPAHTITKKDTDILNFISHVSSLDDAKKIVRRIAHNAIIAVIAQTPVSDYVAGRIDNVLIKRFMTRELARIHCGIFITNVSSSKYMPPQVLDDDFQAVNKAQSEKALDMEKAVRNRVSTLSEMAGENWEELLTIIREYENAAALGSQSADSAFKRVEAYLLSGQTGGYAAQLCEQARLEKTAAIEKTRSKSARFEKLLVSYRRNPSLFTDQMLQEALADIWESPHTKTIYTPAGKTLFLEMDK